MHIGKGIKIMLVVYLSSFLLAFPIVAQAYERPDVENGNIISRNGNPDLIWSILHNSTTVNTNTTLLNTSHYVLNSPYEVIGKYSPLLQQGYIFITWIHNFLTPQNFCRGLKDVGAIPKSETISQCLTEIKSKSLWKIGNLWRIKKIVDQDGIWRYKAAIMHMITPKELFKTISIRGKVIKNGEVLDNLVKAGVYKEVSYGKIASCSAANISTEYCVPETFKAGSELYFDIVSAVARQYNTDYGFVIVEHVSIHHKKSKHHHGLKTKVTVKYYLDSYPEYYIMVPPNSPGVGVSNVGFMRNGVGYIKVDPNTAVGWDFTKGSVKFYEKSKSGWSAFVSIIVGIGIGGLGALMGGGLPWAISQGTQAFSYIGTGLTTIGALYTATSTVETISQGSWSVYHGGLIPEYSKIDTSKGDIQKDLYKADANHWLNNLGNEMDGTRTMISEALNLISYHKTNTRSTNPSESVGGGNIMEIMKRMIHNHGGYTKGR